MTGLGLITSIGNDRAEVLQSLRECRTGIEYFAPLDRDGVPMRLAGTVKGFEFPELQTDEWVYPDDYEIPRTQLRSMSPNVVYGYCAMQQAIADAQLTPELVSNPRTGAMCASAGSPWLTYDYLDMMLKKGPQRVNPMAMVACIAGTLNMNLVASFGIKGASLGFSSACASSAHALGAAFDKIRMNRQDIVFVAGAEECNLFSILPFVATRALTTSKGSIDQSVCVRSKTRRLRGRRRGERFWCWRSWSMRAGAARRFTPRCWVGEKRRMVTA